MLRQQQNKQHQQFASAALLVLATLFATFVLSCAQEEKKAPAPARTPHWHRYIRNLSKTSD